MARIGFDASAGHLDQIETVLVEHPQRVATSGRLTAPALVDLLCQAEPPLVLDVRNPGERDGGYAYGTAGRRSPGPGPERGRGLGPGGRGR